MSLDPATSPPDVLLSGSSLNAKEDGMTESTLANDLGTPNRGNIVEESVNEVNASELPVEVPPEPTSALGGEESSTMVSGTEPKQKERHPGANIASMATSLSNGADHSSRIAASSSQGTSDTMELPPTADGSHFIGVDEMSLVPIDDPGRGDEGVAGNDNLTLTRKADTVVSSTSEEAVRSLDSETDGQEVGTEEEALLKERLSLGIDAPLTGVHAPLEHSASITTVPSSSPRQDIDDQSLQDPSMLSSSSEGVAESDLGTTEQGDVLYTDANGPGLATVPSELRSDNAKELTPVVTPSTLQEDVEMLNSRLEIGLGVPVDMQPPPGLMKRSISGQPVPSDSPTPESLPGDTGLPSNLPDSMNDTEREEGLHFAALVTPGLVPDQPSPPLTPKTAGSSLGVQAMDIPQANGNGNIEAVESLDTPIARRLHIVDHNLETSSEEPLVIDLRSGVPLLDLPTPSDEDSDIASKARIQMDRSASMVPEPPTSPRLELDMEQMEVRTPTTGAAKLEFLSADRTRQQASSHNRLDFVDEARSERSIATSVAPIAPNSPRFITPLLTPSSDANAFSFYEAGCASDILKTTSDRSPTGAGVEESAESGDGKQEFVPELTDALNTSFRQEITAVEHPHAVSTPLAPVNEEGTHVSPIQPPTVRARPGHHSSTSAWSINRASGWFNSAPEKVPGRASMEVAEGEFSRPVSRIRSGEYPPDSTRVTASSPSRNDPNRCIIM